MRTEEQAQIRESWSRIAPGYDRHVTPTHMWLAGEGLRRVGLGRGERFLDVAAGSGALAIPAARLGARVLATDLSAAMLERLRERARAEGLEIDTRVMDGHALELEDGGFDVAGSQFGVMLFPDLPRGLAEMARVVRPGGRVLLHVYGDPGRIEFLRFFMAAVQAVVPGFTGPPTDPPPLPFQVADPAKLRREMEAAGLRDVRVETITERLEFRDGAGLWSWLVSSNPIVEGILAELDLGAEQESAVRAALDRAVAGRRGDGETAVLTNPIHIGIGSR